MALSAVVSPDPLSKIEHEPTMVLQAAVELASSKFLEPFKPLPVISTAEVPRDDSIVASELEDAVVELLPAEKVEKPLGLGDIASSILEPTSGAKKLRKMLLETKELIVCPGVYDGLSARTAIELGFNAMYMVRDILTYITKSKSLSVDFVLMNVSPQTGAGTTASRIGQPDLAIAQLHEMRENAEMIANLDPFGPPLIADMDTGYGGKSAKAFPF